LSTLHDYYDKLFPLFCAFDNYRFFDAVIGCGKA
jgi:hypothetical protein